MRPLGCHGHAYHRGCLLKWLELSPNCPLCKAHALGNWRPSDAAAFSGDTCGDRINALTATHAASFNAVTTRRCLSFAGFILT